MQLILNYYKMLSHNRPVQAQRGSRMLRLTDFMTTARYGGRLSALRTGRLYPQEYSWYSFSLRAESTHGLVGRKYVTEKIQ